MKGDIYLYDLFQELKQHELPKITIYVDNQSAKYLANDSVLHAGTKHVDIRHHFIRNTVNSETVNLEYSFIPNNASTSTETRDLRNAIKAFKSNPYKILRSHCAGHIPYL